MTIPPQDRRRLLLLARDAIRKNLDPPVDSEATTTGTAVTDRAPADVDPTIAALEAARAGRSALSERRAAFVTLHVDGDLRGCVGILRPTQPLVELVPELAIASAADDSRFAALTSTDMAALSIEISVLAPPTRVDAPAGIEIGRHGLMITLGASRGLLLPQVAIEQGWDRETFLSWTCRKAGLAPDAWHDWAGAGSKVDTDADSDAGTRANTDLVVETFTADVFGEEHL